MKTAVLGEDEDGRVVYNRTLGEFARHYGFLPKACRAYRPEPSLPDLMAPLIDLAA